ncbi:hypothetical protein MY011_42580 [Escherichia coli]|nr:hypothetical protein MY011_42580 [Escherichia coli]
MWILLLEKAYWIIYTVYVLYVHCNYLNNIIVAHGIIWLLITRQMSKLDNGEKLMDAANLSPSGRVLPLAATINGNNPVDEKTGVMQPENGTNRTIRILGGVLISAGALAAIGAGIASLCVEDPSQKLGLGIAAGVLGGVTTLGGGLAMKYA